ncbi:MAG: DUF1905 domain-containing protein [Candidatus Doudnabacteria bacterium CG10_big_fil_rev_8_21_14_0_10_42_18]|uniref:DUF1905 domain-containing protein n=1 Tax=Candidatus Doudnabacteria bacterium CG10_big_fil_rev_8_21_14_0_10_42_18 TaxID=1974552 RepID=A0A2H0VBR8_9BACT|nr:MAG: DUF1905 domain-containing protein [Candidatus Doudnabacteria bacterium CG10_big_fil_rev_8_21_14_0_10_42_18]
MHKSIYKIKEKVWFYSGMASWHFVSVSKKASKEIKRLFGRLFGVSGRGFGSISVILTVGKTGWQTSIFSDKRRGAYILPIKKDVRKKEGIIAGKILSFSVEIRI